MKNSLSIYLHWPFCVAKCPYCDFMSVPLKENADAIAEYLLSDLKNSLEEFAKGSSINIKTVFFGGGTPSLMSPAQIAKILNYLNKNHNLYDNAEVTLEANPATFSKQKLQDFKSAGINRLSLGIQSFQNKNLKFLGRIYDSVQALKSAEIVAEIFENFSFDFMYGYETQNISDLESDLRTAVNFECHHISCYQLTIEKNTPFFKRMQSRQIRPISEDREIEYFNFIANFLKNFSINRYEISNYATSGFESRHNLAYWNYEDYLGVGPSAHSRLTIDGCKTELQKFYSIDEWLQKISISQSTYAVKRKLSEQEQLEETFIMGLRLTNGINLSNINAKFSESLLNPILRKIEFLSQQGLFQTISPNFIKLTEQGLLKANSVIDFLLS